MRRIVFIANIEMNPTSGIFLKVKNQCIALSYENECVLVCKKKGFITKVLFHQGTQKAINQFGEVDNIQNILSIGLKEIETPGVSVLYFRLTLKPAIEQVRLLKHAKEKGIRVFYEIPTYPYFYEQINNSHRKILTFGKMMVEKLIFQVSQKYIDCIPVIISNSKIKKKNKFLEITNGISSEHLPFLTGKLKKDDSFNFIGVGTLVSYHGYERLIKSIYDYGVYEDNKEIYFHIVGNGPELKKLEKLVYKLGMQKNIIFYGALKNKDLDEIFDKADIGVGALALYKRHADIDTTLKVVEYLVRGLPILTSGELRQNLNEIFSYKVNNDESIFRIDEIISYTNNYKAKITKSDICELRSLFSWETIMRDIIHGNEFK